MASETNTIGIRPPGRPLTLTEREVGVLRGMLLANRTLVAIHEATGIPYTTVRRYAKRLEAEAIATTNDSPAARTEGATTTPGA